MGLRQLVHRAATHHKISLILVELALLVTGYEFLVFSRDPRAYFFSCDGSPRGSLDSIISGAYFHPKPVFLSVIQVAHVVPVGNIWHSIWNSKMSNEDIKA
jgi:hypothetical protein